MIGFHSVMERPESVSRVAPPTRIMATIRSGERAEPQSQRADVARGHGGVAARLRQWLRSRTCRSDSGPAAANSTPAPCPIAALRDSPRHASRDGQAIRRICPTWQRATRKLIGTIVLLLFLAIYALGAAAIGAGRITLAPHWAQLAYFVDGRSRLGDPGGAADPLDAASRLSPTRRRRAGTGSTAQTARPTDRARYRSATDTRRSATPAAGR